MKLLTQQEMVQKLQENKKELRICKSSADISAGTGELREDLNTVTDIRVFDSLFILNKNTATDFFNIVFEGHNDNDLTNIINIFKIYAYFDYLLYTVNKDGFAISSRDLDATYIKREPVKEIKPQNIAFQTNLCQEIAIGPMMLCSIGTKNAGYSYQELYEKVIYPQFKAMLKDAIGLEIKHMSQFDDRAFELLKMAKI